MRNRRMRRCAAILIVSAIAMISPGIASLGDLPDALVLRAGGGSSIESRLPLYASVMGSGNLVTAARSEETGVQLTASDETGDAEVVLKLLGVIPVKTVRVTVEPEKRLIPGGRSLGVAVKSQGVVVVGASDLGKNRSPASAAGIRTGDVITQVNRQDVLNAQTLSDAMQEGTAAHLRVLRDDVPLEFDVTPELDPRDGNYRLGVWVRENTAGVGTLTYYDPETGRYGALGHAITDVDTGTMFPVREGAVYENSVTGITRGEEGTPGELSGGFMAEGIALGEIDRNTECGVFGEGEAALAADSLYPNGLPIASRGEIHPGSAEILTCVGGEEIRAYDIQIEKVNASPERHTRSMVIRVTDPGLIEKTGGIVQGMSGSPIVQDGKLAGAVTHVLIDDPTRGYGIAIEAMLEAAG